MRCDNHISRCEVETVKVCINVIIQCRIMVTDMYLNLMAQQVSV